MQDEHERLQSLPIKVEFQGRIRRFRVGGDDFVIPALAGVLGVAPLQLFVHDGHRIMAMDSIVKDQDTVHRSKALGRIPRFFAEIKPGGISPNGERPENLALSLHRIYRALDDVLVEVKDIKRSLDGSKLRISVPHESLLAEDKLRSDPHKELLEIRDNSELVDDHGCETNDEDHRSDDETAQNDGSSVSLAGSRCEIYGQGYQSDHQKAKNYGSYELVDGSLCDINGQDHQSAGQDMALENASACSISNGYDPDASDSGRALLKESSDGKHSSSLSADEREFIDADTTLSSENIDDLDEDLIDRMADVMSDTALSDDFSRLSDPKSDNLVDSFVLIRRQSLQQSQLERMQSLSASIRKVEAEHGDTLQRLADLGYSNSKLNASVLVTHNYDLQATVQALQHLRSMSMNM